MRGLRWWTAVVALAAAACAGEDIVEPATCPPGVHRVVAWFCFPDSCTLSMVVQGQRCAWQYAPEAALPSYDERESLACSCMREG